MKKENKMFKIFYKFIVLALIVSFLSFSVEGVNNMVQAQDSFPPKPEPYLSEDGLTLYNAYPILVIQNDPDPAMQGIKVPAPDIEKALTQSDAAGATFSFTYVAAGGTDQWGEPCFAFPSSAKTAFNAAANIWANIIKSSVPITIRACWANLGGVSTLGYSGGGPLHRNFSGAPLADTWYVGSLANALHGSDLSPSGPYAFDMHITYNSNYTWYYGTDSNPPAGQHDLVTVATHEIAHGLNFSGSADYAGGLGSYGYSLVPLNPHIFDTFMESGSGTKLTSYSSPSAELGTLLTSNDLFFDGTNANAANGGSRVKMYAPSTWKDGSSYSHLDYTTFASTQNRLMVYAIASGSANHNPGPVTKGILKDLGWKFTSSAPTKKTYLPIVTQKVKSSTKPKAGFWEDPGDVEFYVTTNQANVDNFAIYISVTGCGNYKITHNPLEPIASGQFSFTGAFYANGTFDTTTSAHGTTGLNSFYISGCGNVTGGPWSWAANWKNTSQPIIKIEGEAQSVIPEPVSPRIDNHYNVTIVE
jgi:hypothetical protein